MSTPLEDFRLAFGSQWYHFCNSPLWKAAKLALIQSGPAAKMLSQTPADIKEHGSLYAAQQQGWNAVLDVMENLMIFTGDAPQDVEATYETEREDQPAPRRTTGRKRK